MTFMHCDNCSKPTGFRRAFGMGTFLGVVFTGGLLFLCLPFYPKRCVVCGASESDLRRLRPRNTFAQTKADAKETAVRIGYVLLALVALGLVSAAAHCGDSGGAANPSPMTEDTPGPARAAGLPVAFSVLEVANHDPRAVERLLGPGVRQPPEPADRGVRPVTFMYHRPDSVEVSFIRGRADWITYYPSKLPYSPRALEALGLPPDVPPSFANEHVLEWKGLAGLREVRVFPGPGGVSYVLVVVRTEL